MLTPTADDPRRKSELDRQKRDPLSFGVAGKPQGLPKDWKPDSGLKPVVTIIKTPAK
jgi:hypothetical protein